MSCIRCKSEKILSVAAKCSDLCTITYKPENYEPAPDYVPGGIGIGGGDYIDFNYCLACGQIQDKFPKEPPRAEEEDD